MSKYLRYKGKRYARVDADSYKFRKIIEKENLDLLRLLKDLQGHLRSDIDAFASSYLGKISKYESYEIKDGESFDDSDYKEISDDFLKKAKSIRKLIADCLHNVKNFCNSKKAVY